MAVFWVIVAALCVLAWALLCWLFPATGKLAAGLARAVGENIRAGCDDEDSGPEAGGMKGSGTEGNGPEDRDKED